MYGIYINNYGTYIKEYKERAFGVDKLFDLLRR